MKIEFDDFLVEYDDSQEVKNAVFDRLIQWYTEQEAFNGECICQNDNCIIDSPQVISDIADHIIKFKSEYKD